MIRLAVRVVSAMSGGAAVSLGLVTFFPGFVLCLGALYAAVVVALVLRFTVLGGLDD